MKTLIVDTDDVLDLFGAGDRDIFAKGTIEDAIYDGTLKSAEPERKTGLWVDGKCNRCGTHAPYWAMASTYYYSEYCPHCGAKMNVGVKHNG